MLSRMRCNRSKIFQLLFLCLLMFKSASAQGLDSKLAQKADFIPTASSTKDQLIQLAQHYRIPMGVEWVVPSDEIRLSAPLTAQPTVMEMVNSILEQVPNYKVEIKDGVANIASRSISEDPYNFLNLRIPEFKVEKENVYGAEFRLRLGIDMTLHPERYQYGWNGGYGHGPDPDSKFELKNITFSGENLTVRDILNRIVAMNGNALWVVELAPAHMMKGEPFFAQFASEDNDQTDFFWQIIPLSRGK